LDWSCSAGAGRRRLLPDQNTKLDFRRDRREAVFPFISSKPNVFQKSGLPADSKGSPFREFSRSHWVGWSGQITNALTVILFLQKRGPGVGSVCQESAEYRTASEIAAAPCPQLN
jgi:hypothetical protein